MGRGLRVLSIGLVASAGCAGSAFVPFPDPPDEARSWVTVERSSKGIETNVAPVDSPAAIEGVFSEVVLLAYAVPPSEISLRDNDCRLKSPLQISLVEVGDEARVQAIPAWDGLPSWAKDAVLPYPAECSGCPSFGQIHQFALEPYTTVTMDVRDSDPKFAEPLESDAVLIGLNEGAFLIADHGSVTPVEGPCAHFNGAREPRAAAIGPNRYWVAWGDGSLIRVQVDREAHSCVVESATVAPSAMSYPIAVAAAPESEATEVFVLNRNGPVSRYDGTTWTQPLDVPPLDDDHAAIGEAVWLAPGRVAFSHATANVRFFDLESGVSDVEIELSGLWDTGVTALSYDPERSFVLAGVGDGSIRLISSRQTIVESIEAISGITSVTQVLPRTGGFLSVWKGGSLRFYDNDEGYCSEGFGVPGVSTGQRPKLGIDFSTTVFFGDMLSSDPKPSSGEARFSELIWIDIE